MDTYFVTEEAASCIVDSTMDVMQYKIHGFALAVHAVIIQIEDFPRNIDGDILSPEYVLLPVPLILCAPNLSNPARYFAIFSYK